MWFVVWGWRLEGWITRWLFNGMDCAGVGWERVDNNTITPGVYIHIHTLYFLGHCMEREDRVGWTWMGTRDPVRGVDHVMNKDMGN